MSHMQAVENLTKAMVWVFVENRDAILVSVPTKRHSPRIAAAADNLQSCGSASRSRRRERHRDGAACLRRESRTAIVALLEVSVIGPTHLDAHALSGFRGNVGQG